MATNGPTGRHRAPEETRARLIDAAEAAFAERGYAGASIQQICRTARVSVGSFYHHFDDKAALTAALLERAHERLVTTFAGIDPGRPQTIETAVGQLLEGDQAAVNRSLREAVELDPKLGDAAAATRAAIHGRLTSTLRAARAHADAEYAVDAPALAWTFFSLVRDAMARRDGPSPRTIATVISYCAAARANNGRLI